MDDVTCVSVTPTEEKSFVMTVRPLGLCVRIGMGGFVFINSYRQDGGNQVHKIYKEVKKWQRLN